MLRRRRYSGYSSRYRRLTTPAISVLITTARTPRQALTLPNSFLDNPLPRFLLKRGSFCFQL